MDSINVELAAEEATRALDLLLNNQFGEALKRMKPKYGCSSLVSVCLPYSYVGISL